jgi:hypothetical protein
MLMKAERDIIAAFDLITSASNSILSYTSLAWRCRNLITFAITIFYDFQ